MHLEPSLSVPVARNLSQGYFWKAYTVKERFTHDRRGVTALEYALIAAFLSIVVYGAVVVYADNLGAAWLKLGTAIPTD